VIADLSSDTLARPAAQVVEPVETVRDIVEMADVVEAPEPATAPVDEMLAARIARLEARLEEQDAALRRVLTLMVDFIENEESKVPRRGTAA
jgi:general secretion pathway protein A